MIIVSSDYLIIFPMSVVENVRRLWEKTQELSIDILQNEDEFEDSDDDSDDDEEMSPRQGCQQEAVTRSSTVITDTNLWLFVLIIVAICHYLVRLMTSGHLISM
jgi:hypothetical protein